MYRTPTPTDCKFATDTRDYQDIVDKLNAEDSFLKNTCLTVTRLEDGLAVTQMNATEEVLNIYGMVHGGAVFTLADTTAGVCALTNTPHVVTLGSSINFIRAATPGLLTATATRVHAGKTTGVYDVEIVNEKGKLVANATFTMFFYRDMLPGPKNHESRHKNDNDTASK